MSFVFPNKYEAKSTIRRDGMGRRVAGYSNRMKKE